MTESNGRPRRIAVLGAGPVGLDAALAASDAGYAVRVYEAEGTPAANVRQWGHVRMFSPWSMNASTRMRAHLREIGLPLSADGDAFPTGHDLADRVLDPLWTRSPAASALRLGARVIAVGRGGLLKHEEIGTPERGRHPFRILLRDPEGREWVELSDVVIDTTGKYGNPNTLGDGGIPAPGERLMEERIARRIPNLEEDRASWLGRTVLLAGSGHSAQTAAAEFARLGKEDGTRVIWVLRKDRPDWGSIEGDPLAGRRALTEMAEALASGSSATVEAATGSVVDELAPQGGRIRVRLRDVDGSDRTIEVDRVLSLTGGVGDHTIYRQLQIHECYATAGLMNLSAALLAEAGGDCLDQTSHGVDTLKSPEPDFFLLGDKSYGRNSTFLLQVGWQQVDEIFAELARAR